VDGLPVFVRRSRTVLQGDLPILLVCHLLDPGAGEDVLYHGLFFQHMADRTECANEPRGLLHRSFPHGQRSSEDLRTRRRKAPFKTKTRSFGGDVNSIAQKARGCKLAFCPASRRRSWKGDYTPWRR
jgi:hypothetical protein